MGKKPVLLAILDGVGYAPKGAGNAFDLANKPNFDKYIETYPNMELRASGQLVGLPDGQMGNSEVGHLNIGAGRIVYQSLELINQKIKTGEINDNEAINSAIEYVKDNGGKLHIWGLLSDGGVHSHINHYKGVLRLADSKGAKVVSHAFLDGRDVGPTTAITFIDELEETINELGNGHIASVSGRYYAMDRDKRYDRIELAYNAICKGQADKFATAQQLVQSNYDNDVVDEFVLPGVVEGVEGTLEDGDAIVFVNFRPDRAIQLSTAVTNPDFNEIEIDRKKIRFVSMMKYADTVIGDCAYDKVKVDVTLGDYLSEKGLKQLRIAETEKYAHVTFFFDGGVDKEIEGATRILVPSPKVATYDLQPEMSAYEVKDRLLEELDNDYDVIILNFANPDMVGHTTDIAATIKAVETVDACLGEVVDKALDKGFAIMVTSDHGNSEQMLDEQGNKFSAHSTNEVPFIMIGLGDVKLADEGKLGDIAPTILDILDVEIPNQMTGCCLIK
jgi:2,3-bisphosphoglycerate-independent phosphoglycerate mutase